MNSAMISQWKQKLRRDREQLFRSLQSLDDDTRAVELDGPQDVGDFSLSSMSKESLFQQRTQLQGRLRMIDSALRRIEEGSFGSCEMCGEEINARRLEALPWASNCIRCQEELEQERLRDQTASNSMANRMSL